MLSSYCTVDNRVDARSSTGAKSAELQLRPIAHASARCGAIVKNDQSGARRAEAICDFARKRSQDLPWP